LAILPHIVAYNTLIGILGTVQTISVEFIAPRARLPNSPQARVLPVATLFIRAARNKLGGIFGIIQTNIIKTVAQLALFRFNFIAVAPQQHQRKKRRYRRQPCRKTALVPLHATIRPRRSPARF
jgi:hypothetical protein